MRLPGPIALILPGLLIAATGVGAGDLAGAALAGSRLGLGILWAVVLGAVLKYMLTEGLARWQLASGTTLLEGLCRHLGRPARWIFAIYLGFWTLAVGLALISACGVATHALLPVFADPATGKIVWGITHSLLGLLLVWLGSFAVFESIMAACVAVMFLVVLVTACYIGAEPTQVLSGLFIPRIPSALAEDGSDQSLAWTLTLLGGVGGTLTILCYGYWIREKGREGMQFLRDCRIDLAIGYIATAAFGIAMIIIAAQAEISGKGAGLIIQLAAYLRGQIGDTFTMVFLVGAWAAVFSSLLGVWQAVPYLFADFVRLGREQDEADEAKTDADTSTKPDLSRRTSYRLWLLVISLVPLLGLGLDFSIIQRIYGVLGSLLIPLLALVLLLLARHRSLPEQGRTGPLGLAGLIAAILVFGWIGLPKLLAAW